MSLRDYIVIVHPPQQGPNTTMISTAQPPRVVKIQRVGSPQEAASRADLAAQGVRLVDVREVAEWLDDQCGSARAHWFLARFGGGDG